MTEIRRVGVLGCGLMGSGIAQVAATAGYETTVRDVAQPVWDKARAGIEKSLAKFVEKGKLAAGDRDAALKRLGFTTTTADLQRCDIVVEAVTEDLELKNSLWRELDARCGPATIFASNTSSLTIAAMAAATQRADRFVGLHFFNPVPLMPLVEVVRTVTTSEETFRRAFAFTHAARLRRARYDLPDRRDHVHRVPRAAVRAPATSQAHGARRHERPEERQGLLRLLRRSAAGHRPGRLTAALQPPPE